MLSMFNLGLPQKILRPPGYGCLKLVTGLLVTVAFRVAEPESQEVGGFWVESESDS